MIIRTVLHILNDVNYHNKSDRGVYIRNKTNGILWDEVVSSIDYEYEETDIPIEPLEVPNEEN